MTTHTPSTYNPSIAHIEDADGNVFQALNETGDDWDEAATLAQREAFYASKGQK